MFQNFNTYSSSGQPSTNYFNAMYRTKCEPDQWRNSPGWSSNATSNEEQEQPSLSSGSVTSGSNAATPTSTSNNATSNSSSTTSQLAGGGNQSAAQNSFAFSNAQGLPGKLQVSARSVFSFDCRHFLNWFNSWSSVHRNSQIVTNIVQMKFTFPC